MIIFKKKVKSKILFNNTTDVSPVINWCNSEHKQLYNITFENENENPKEYLLSFEAAYELCNQFRETLKPVFQIIGLKIDEFEYSVVIIYRKVI